MQGEPVEALSQMAQHKHKIMILKKAILFSSNYCFLLVIWKLSLRIH
ncbi:hypothetical protein ACVXZZ_13875 [Staphylococcus aureus]